MVLQQNLEQRQLSQQPQRSYSSRTKLLLRLLVRQLPLPQRHPMSLPGSHRR